MRNNNKTGKFDTSSDKISKSFFKKDIVKKFFRSPYFYISCIFTFLTFIFYWQILTVQGFLWNDFIEQNFPYRIFSAVSLKNGVFPFWNPFVFSGMPFFADVQAAVLYPFNLVLTFFVSDEWLNPVILEYQVIFHILLSGLFMFIMARDFGCEKKGALLSGITFMFSSFLTFHIFHINLIHTAVWFPLIIFLFKRMIERRDIIYLSLLILIMACVFFSGYPQLLMHIYYWLAAYFIFSSIIRLKRGSTLKTEGIRSVFFVLMTVLSLGITGVQILSTQELRSESARPTLSFEKSCEASFRPYRIPTLLNPNLFGKPGKNYWGLSATDVNPGAHYYWETPAYCGVLPLFLAILAVVFIRKPFIYFFAGIAVIAFFLAMGDSFFLYWIIYKLFPGFNRFRIPSRFLFMFITSVSLLSGFGLQLLTHKKSIIENSKKRFLTKFLFTLIGITMLTGIIISTGSLQENISNFMVNSGLCGTNISRIVQYVEKLIYPSFIKEVWITVLFISLSCALIILSINNKLSQIQIFTGAFIILFSELYIAGNGYTSKKIDPSAVYRKTPLIKQIKKQLESEYFRINSRNSKPGTMDNGGKKMIFRRNQGSVHRFFQMEGYNPLKLKHQIVNRYKESLDILNVKYMIAADKTTGRTGFKLNEGYFPRARMVYDYEVNEKDSIYERIDDSPILQHIRRDGFNHYKTVVIEDKPGFKAFNWDTEPKWSAEIKEYTLNKIRIEVNTEQKGLLFLSEMHYPAWKAKVDGKETEVLRADYALRAIEVPEGRHTIVNYFRSDNFYKGLSLTLGSLMITLFLTGFGIYIKIKRKQIR